MKNEYQVIVVGGGLWGLSVAWHLAKRGCRDVAVLERNPEPASETTPRAAGLVGQLRSSPTMCQAIQYGLKMLGNFTSETGYDPGFRRSGSLLVAMREERIAAFGNQVSAAQANGVEAEFVDLAEIRRLAPAINTDPLLGGYFVPGDGYVDPREFALGFEQSARELGVDLCYDTRVTDLVVNDGRIDGVTCGSEQVTAEQVVVTAGPWTGLLAASVGNVPIQTIRHQRVETEPTDGIPDHHPVVRVNDVSCYVRPEKGGYLYGFFEPEPTPFDLAEQPVTFTSDDLEPPVSVMDEARRRLTTVFPILEQIPVRRRVQGITSFSPDGRYVIGPVPGVSGLTVATGCAALGIAGSAAIGDWIAEMITTGQSPDALREFDPLRFAEHADDHAWVAREATQVYANYYSLVPGVPDNVSAKAR